ncbi:MAG: nitroreductase family protein [Candidatus Omnitrophica bacterium]|nr:nitroreductase family protein [Candidatus Omnitrophota bacterium]
MITIDVNHKSCKHDGKCVEVCPMQILTMNEKERVPEFIPGGGDICINCGHCFAVCPPGCISLSTMNAADAMVLDRSHLPNSDQVEFFLKGRRSIRKYTDEPVTKESIEKLLDISRYAPSGINRQPVNWSVILGQANVHALGEQVTSWMESLLNVNAPMAASFRFERIVESWKKGEDRICRGATALVIAYGLKDDPMVPQSCTIAATYLELAAFGLGLGACWAGYVGMAINMSDDVRKATGISSRATAGAVMMLGHSKYKYSRIPLRNSSRIIWK